MTLLSLLVVLVVLALLIYCLSLLPIPGKLRNIIACVAIILVCLWLLQEVGLLPALGRPLRLR